MIITYHGDQCFKIQSGKFALITDPLPRFKGDVTLITTPQTDPEWPPVPHQFAGPGEYEAHGIPIRGFASNKGNTAYITTIDSIRLCFLGGATNLDQEAQEKITDAIDILFVPTGIDQKIIKQLQPKIVIPSYAKSISLTAFLKAVEQTATPQDKLTIKHKDLPAKLTVTPLKA